MVLVDLGRVGFLRRVPLANLRRVIFFGLGKQLFNRFISFKEIVIIDFNLVNQFILFNLIRILQLQFVKDGCNVGGKNDRCPNNLEPAKAFIIYC